MGFSAFLDLSQLRTSSTLESWETSLAKSAGQIMPAGSAQVLTKGLQNSGRTDEITNTMFLERGCFGAVDGSNSNNQFVSLFAFDCKLPIGIEWNVSFSLVHS